MHGIHSACIAYASAAITQEEQVVLYRDLSRTQCPRDSQEPFLLTCCYQYTDTLRICKR